MCENGRFRTDRSGDVNAGRGEAGVHRRCFDVNPALGEAEQNRGGVDTVK